MAGVKQAPRAVLLLLTQVIIARCAADFGDRISFSGGAKQTVSTSSSTADNAIPQIDPTFDNPSEEREGAPGAAAAAAAPLRVEAQPGVTEVEGRAGKSSQITGDVAAAAPRWPPPRARSRPRPLRSRFRGREQSSLSGGTRGSRLDLPPPPPSTKTGSGTRASPNSPPAGSRLRYNRYVTRPAGAGNEGTRLEKARGRDGGPSVAEIRLEEATSGGEIKDDMDVYQKETYVDTDPDEYSHSDPSVEPLSRNDGAERGAENGGVEKDFSKILSDQLPRESQKQKEPERSKSTVVGAPFSPADGVAPAHFPAAVIADERVRLAFHGPPSQKEKNESEIGAPSDAETKREEKLAPAGQLQSTTLTQRETVQNPDTVRDASTRARNDNRRFEKATLDKSQFETVMEPLTSHRLDLLNVSTTMSNTEFMLDSKIFDKVYSPFTLPSVPSPISRGITEGHRNNGPAMTRNKPLEGMVENGSPLSTEGYTQIDHPKLRDYFHEARHKPGANGDKSSDEKFHKLIYESTQDIIERASLEERRKALFKPRPNAHRSRHAGGVGGIAKVQASGSSDRSSPSVTPKTNVNAGASFSFMTIKRFPLDSQSDDAHAEGSTSIPVYSIPPVGDLHSSASEFDLQAKPKDALEGLSPSSRRPVVKDLSRDEDDEEDQEGREEIEGEIDTLFSPLDYLLEEHGITDETFGKPSASERLRSRPQPTGHFGETKEDQRIIEEARAGLDIHRQRDPEHRGGSQEEQENQRPGRFEESSRERSNQRHRFDQPVRPRPVKRENTIEFGSDVPDRQQALSHEQNHVRGIFQNVQDNVDNSLSSSTENENQNHQNIANSNEKFEQTETNQVAVGLNGNDPSTIKDAGLLPSLQQFDESQGEALRSILPFFRAPPPPPPHTQVTAFPPPRPHLPPRAPRRDKPLLSHRPIVNIAPLPPPASGRPQLFPKGRESFGNDRVANEAFRLRPTLIPPMPPPFAPPTEPPLDMRPPALILRPTLAPDVLPPPPTPDGQVKLPALIDTVPPFSESMEAQNAVDSFPSGVRPSQNAIEEEHFKNENVGSTSQTFTEPPRIEFNEFRDLIDFELNRTPRDKLAKDLISREGGNIPEPDSSPSTANDFLKPPPFPQRPTSLVPPPPPPPPSAKKPLFPIPLARPGHSRPQVPLPRPTPRLKGRMEKPFPPPQVLVNDIPLAFTTRGATFAPVHINVPGHRLKISPPGGIRPPNQQAFPGNKPSLQRENRSPSQIEKDQRNNFQPPIGFRNPRPGAFEGLHMKVPPNQLIPPPALGHGTGALPGPRPAIPLPKENAISEPIRGENAKPNLNGIALNNLPAHNFNSVRPIPISLPPQTAIPSTPPAFRVPLPSHSLPIRRPPPFHISENMSPPPPPPPQLPEVHPRPPPFHPSTNVPTIPKPPHFAGDDFDAPPRKRGFSEIESPFEFQNSLELQGRDTRNRVRFPSGNELESDFVPVHDVSQPLPPMILQPRLSESHAKMMRNLRYGINGEPLDIWIPIQVTGRK
ncbi:uncharacterized protein LOC122255655 [Penaeus japonicus]|uniref:uncharacterized protein LOC122255655 n=1 Tax=Penaeus japonicus TaxID=27405 RepID=UPI001C70C31A|nr:uncharacterized protein LOC122255655 [Penaeus japonicus]